MAIPTYSHAFFVGSFDSPIQVDSLNPSEWTKEVIKQDGNGRYADDRGYKGLCSLYYKAHIDAMIEADSELQNERPDFLKDVHHFYYNIPQQQQTVKFLGIKTNIDYETRICKLHIFTFPLGISLFAIEIDDSGQELDAITMGHFVIGRWAWTWDSNIEKVKKELDKILNPLKSLLPNKNLENLISGGNKLKIFQTIKLNIDEPSDKMLYEIGTCSSIGCIDNKTDCNSPATSYWTSIVEHNSVSTFRNWKALALVDSFTMLGTENSFNEDDCKYLYFPLIYLRCIFEKTFCVTRNILYREDKDDGKLPEDIVKMEKYYFYDNISHNFQPNLLYRTMAKGLDLKEEREELSKQIKERAKKTRRKKRSLKKSGLTIYWQAFLYLLLFPSFGIFAL